MSCVWEQIELPPGLGCFTEVGSLAAEEREFAGISIWKGLIETPNYG